MNYNLAVDEHGNVTSSLRRNRLVRRDKNFQWIGAVHEYLEVYGKIYDAAIAITHSKVKVHDPARNLKIYEKRLARGEKFSPRDLYYYANELRDHRIFKKAVQFYKKFLATGQGWVEDNLAACGKLADCFLELGEAENALKYVFESFEYDTPRAEFCCRLGWRYMQAEKFKQAAFWYKLATELEKPTSWGMLNHSCWTWLPHLQLCVCYDRLGLHELAFKHNELAAKYIPDDPKIAYNRNYFETVLKK
jgi:tetratricopeptide (TPR) repeat protein